MKKFLAIIAVLFLVLIILIYWSASSTDKKFVTCSIENIEDVEKIDFREHDSVLVAASTLYEGDLIKRLMQGENYRKAWSTPVQVPIAFLDTLKGGLKIKDEGGGMQTQSLELEGENDIKYTLRSVAKDPKKLIPEIAEKLGLENIVVDGISGQHPYAAMLVAELAETAQVLHTHPQVYFIPKQERLGDLNNKYGNRLYLLEYELKSDGNWTNLEDIDEIIDTDNLQELKLQKGSSLSLDNEMLIRTRLFDMLIGDWDRHAKQWGWAIQKKKDRYKAIPIPGDRDNAFFKLTGLVPSIITNKNIEPEIRPFEEDIDHMPGLVYPNDRYFLLKVPKETFIRQAEILQQNMTEEKIREAFMVWPKAIAELDQEEITEKLLARKAKLPEYASSFYQIIQEQGELTEPMKGSEDIDIPEGLLRCFECLENSEN
ncbi:hypothetical protein MKO06_13900 [Gramella sp. GC03-9]|uniref:Uncharacterized protein n=1 Tax=Christiangramia oceanisediminis TaxID=2920386 RepID=A0A9X2KZD8_9FLAO|nr:hypothetical protein [Gramella oceanisediminis]MCP9201006.1 hypothetical protein [Gramella oceanisediminis]